MIKQVASSPNNIVPFQIDARSDPNLSGTDFVGTRLELDLQTTLDLCTFIKGLHFVHFKGVYYQAVNFKDSLTSRVCFLPA